MADLPAVERATSGHGVAPGSSSAAGSGPDDLATVIGQGSDVVEQLATAYQGWGLGTADRWDLDQTTTGTISWTFPDKVASAPAQILASSNPAAGSWRWAWANDSILPDLSRDSRALRDWGDAQGHAFLVNPQVEVDDDLADTLTAIAVRVSRATGVYRGQGASMPIITFGEVTLTPTEGEPTTFSIAVPD